MATILKTDMYQLIEGRHGLFLANPMDMYIGRSLIEYGEFSEIEVALLTRLVPKGGIAVDMGANMGAMTIPLAQKVTRAGFVFAFEPQLLVFQQFCANLALNDVVNVQAIQAGCGSETGSITIHRHNPTSRHNFGGLALEHLAADDPSIRIDIARLDDRIDPRRLDLIKADVEGMEEEALRGAEALIRHFRPALYVENGSEEKSPGLIAFVQDLDYRCWWHFPPLYSPDNHFGNAENLFPKVVSFNMLCLPSERRATIAGLRPVAGPGDHPRALKR